jgi:hypothetical protein
VQDANRATLLDVHKMVLLMLSFMVENAAVWARLYIESLTEGEMPFAD